MKGNYFINAARSRIINNLKQEIRADYVYTLMYPDEYTLTKSIAESDYYSSTSGKEVSEKELTDSEDENECQ